MKCGERDIAIGARTYVMGVVNVTPDSFSDGGAHRTTGAALDHALRLIDEGADIVDVGGESTRPGAADVPVDVERARVLPVIEGLVARGVRNISVDTKNAATARDARAAGASWWNDVTALSHDDAGAAAVAAVAVAADYDAVVLMHWRKVARHDARGDAADYGDEGGVVGAVHAYLVERVGAAVRAGVRPANIVVDPGVGFGKTVDDNLRLLRSSARFAAVVTSGAVLVGPSRKRFLGAVAGVDVAADRDAATHGAVACAIFHGASIVRVHDVRGAVHAAKVVDAVVRVR